MTGYILDTSVWIDFLRGTRPAEVARGYLLSSDPGPLISSIELGELRKVYLEQGFDDETFLEDLALVHSWCDIVDVNENHSIRAGEIRHTIKRRGIGLVDCILLALAEERDYMVVSTDDHFKDDGRAIYIGEGAT